jgi:hypothetical protein
MTLPPSPVLATPSAHEMAFVGVGIGRRIEARDPVERRLMGTVAAARAAEAARFAAPSSARPRGIPLTLRDVHALAGRRRGGWRLRSAQPEAADEEGDQRGCRSASNLSVRGTLTRSRRR